MCSRKVVRVVLLMVLVAAAGCLRDRDTAKREYVRSGDKHFADKKYREAIVEYRNAVEQDERLGEARYKLARAYAMAEDRANAEREFVRAADLMPENAAAQLDAAKALILAGQFEDAKTRAEAVLKKDPKNVDAHILRGNATAGLRDLEGAVSALEEAIELAPERSASYLNLAGLQAARGQRELAEAAFKQAVTVDPKSVAAHLALANFYWSAGRVADAEQTLKRALEIEPRSVLANRALALMYIATKRPAEAERPLRTVVQASSDLQPRLVLADYYIGQGRSADAVKILTELAARKEAFAAARARLAGIEYQAGRRDQAHAMLDQVLSQEPNNAQVLVVKGGWLLGENKVGEALTRAQAATKANPRSPEAHFLLGSVYVAENNAEEAIKAFNEVLRFNPRAVNAQIELARLNLALGRSELAAQLADEAVKNQPGNAGARLMVVRAAFARGDLDRAEAELKPLLAALPSSPELHAQMGQIQLRRGNRAAATRSFERALELDSASLEALTGLVRLDVAAKNVDQARRRVEAHLAKAPTSAPLLLLAARTYATGGDMARAESSLKKAIQLDPSFLEAYNVLGQLYVRQEKLDDALREYQALARQKQNDVAAHTMVGMILQVQNKPAEARKLYEKILEIDPRAVVAANNLAYMHAEAGSNLDMALQLAQTAKSQLPDDPDVNDTLGWVYYKRDLASLALDPLQRSVEKDPSNPLYRYHLGLAYLKVGDKVKARASLEQALKLKSDFEGAPEARKVLASIQG